MKKLLFVLTFCFAGFFTAIAQSSDYAYARDLVYKPLATDTLPVTILDTLLSSDKILLDVRKDSYAKGYSFSISEEKMCSITMLSGNWDSYLFLLDDNFQVINYDDDYEDSNTGSRIVTMLPAGTYYIIATSYSSYTYTYNKSFSLELNILDAKTLRQISYIPQAVEMFTDTITYHDDIVYDKIYNNYYGGYDVNIEGDRVKGYTMQMSPSTYVFYDINSGVDIYLLDNDYNFVGYGHEGIYIENAGTYRLIVASDKNFDSDTTLTHGYTIAVEKFKGASYNTLSYRLINTNEIVNDSLTKDEPVLFPSNDNLCYAKGYEIKTSDTTKYILFEDNNSSLSYDILFLDNNKNMLQKNPYIVKTSPSTTYYFVLLGYSPLDIGDYSFTIKEMAHLPIYYVDAINGNDTNDGLSAHTAMQTLDAALDSSDLWGTYYLTEDYIFDHNINIGFGEILPYGKDIRLSIASNNIGSPIINVFDYLCLGEKDGNFSFILDSVITPADDNTFISGYSDYDIVEINNLKMINYDMARLFRGNNLTINNCEFIGNTIDPDNGEFIDVYMSLKISNTIFSQNNIAGSLFYIQELPPFITDYTPSFEMENTDILSNSMQWPMFFYPGVSATLKSGNVKNNIIENSNTLLGFASYFDINPVSAAGFWAIGANVFIGADFRMDGSNYLFLDSSSKLILTEDIRQPLAATIFPMQSNYYSNGEPSADYYDGRLILSGEESIVAANYNRFAIAQPLNEIWLLHSDGRIYKSGLSIEDEEITENNEIRLYPNPAKDQITIDGIENVNNIQLFNMMGQVVKTINNVNESTTINVSELPAGMYFVRIGNAVKKIMVE